MFPGGRIDPDDRAVGGTEEAAARVAAIRETIEEAGLPVGVVPMPSAEVAADLRAGLHAGQGFGALLAAAGFALDLGALVPFARWRPAADESVARVFDTRFYLARLPVTAVAPSVDATETVRLLWTTAAAALAAAAAGTARLIFPTRRTLERLAGFDSFGAAVADAARHPIRTVTPWIEVRDGADWLCIPDDLGYPVTTEPLDTARRG